MFDLAILNQDGAQTPFLMNNEGTVATRPVTDDTGARTFTYSSSKPEVVANVASGFGSGSFGWPTTGFGTIITATTEYTDDLNLRGQDYCIEMMFRKRQDSNAAAATTSFRLETDTGGGNHQYVYMYINGADDQGNPAANSTNFVIEMRTNSFNPVLQTITNTEVVLGAGGRYPNDFWRHIAFIRDHSADEAYLYVSGVKQLTIAGGGRMDGDQTAFRFVEQWNPTQSTLQDSVRIVRGNTVYGTGATITVPTSSVPVF